MWHMYVIKKPTRNVEKKLGYLTHSSSLPLEHNTKCSLHEFHIRPCELPDADHTGTLLSPKCSPNNSSCVFSVRMRWLPEGLNLCGANRAKQLSPSAKLLTVTNFCSIRALSESYSVLITTNFQLA